MKFNFRKIASVASSTLMMGSTVALAAAANFPAPFVQNGNADVAIVYGSNAASSDLVAAIDISSELAATLAAQGGSSGSSSSVSGGDFVKLAKPSDELNMGNVVTTVFGTTVTDSDLEDLLADGVYSNDENSDFDYEQRITLGSAMQINFFSDSDYADREPTVGVNLTSNQMVLNYSLEFTDDPDSDVSSGDLVDLETTTITFLGREYYISDFDNSTLDVTLLDTANSGIVSEGETTTVVVGGSSYDVSIEFIGTTSVKLNVNGQITNSLSEGATYKLSDGTYVGIKDILVQDYAGGIKKVEFSLGSGKLELKNGQSIRLNDDSVNEVTAEVKRGTASGGKEKIDRINLVWTTDDDQFITADTELVMPGFENLKFTMGDFVRPSEEVTYVRDGSSTYLQLETVLKDGSVTIPLLFAETTTGNFTGIGKDSGERLVTSVNTNAIFNYSRGDRLFVGSWNTSSDSESYLLRFTDFQNDNGINKTTIQKYSGGSWADVCTDRRGSDTCSIGSLTLTINSISPHPDRAVNFTGSAGASLNHLYTQGGLKVFLPYEAANTSAALGAINFTGAANGLGTTGHNWDSFNLSFVEADKNDNPGAGNHFSVTLNDNSDNEVEAASFESGREQISHPDDSNHILSTVYSDLASMIERTGQSSDQREVMITYSGGEAFAELFLADASAEVSGGSSGSGGTSTLGSITVKDSEVSQVSSKNMIVIGGSCVNTVAASLLGSDSPLCGSDFESSTGVGSGSFLIQSFASPFSSGKVATLVAGYNAADTTNAATYLRTQTVDTTVGKKYTGTSATSATLVTA